MKLATAAALFVAGVVLSFGARGSFSSAEWQVAVLVAAAALVLFAIVNSKNGRRSVVAISIVMLLLGFARGASVGDPGVQDWHNVPDDGEALSLSAWLTDDAQPAGQGVRLHLNAISVDGLSADFPLTVFATGLSDMTGSARRSTGFRYGDVYEFAGRFSAATGEFADASAGTVFTGVVSLVSTDRGNALRRAVGGVREWLSNNLDRTLTEPAAGLAKTVLVNDRTGLPTELTLDFRESGTSHILAISGLHVALVGGLALTLAALSFGRRGQYYLLLPFAVTWGYAALAGFSPSVTRAAIMFSVALLARAAGRQHASVPAIGLAAAVMVAVEPEILKSLSFQLSFAAITGIALMTPRIVDSAGRIVPSVQSQDASEHRFLKGITTGAAVSIAATLATWPLVAVNFGEAPVWGGPATVLMLPAVPLLIVLSAASAVVGGVSTTAGEVIGWPAWLLGEYVSGIAIVFRNLPPGPIDTSGWSALTGLLAYAAIFLVFTWRTVRDAANRSVMSLRSLVSRQLARRTFVDRGVPFWLVGVAGIVAVVAWTGAITSAGSEDLEITFFETDRGDMVLIRTPNGNSALIDGGRDPFGAVRRLDDALPFWDRSLDLLLATHPDADHIGGLMAVIERYEVWLIAEAPTGHASTVHAAWRRAMDSRGDAVTLTPGTVIGLDDGMTLEVLSAGRPFVDASINDASVVTMLRYGDFSMLLTGDITSVSERRLVESGGELQATVLKVPHHGSDTSSTQPFLDAVNPEIAIVQVGTGNRFGHPADAVMGRLQKSVREDRIFITSRDGDVIVTTDGQRVRVAAVK